MVAIVTVAPQRRAWLTAQTLQISKIRMERKKVMRERARLRERVTVPPPTASKMPRRDLRMRTQMTQTAQLSVPPLHKVRSEEVGAVCTIVMFFHIHIRC